MATILDKYDWNRGDMLYGIGEEINKYIDHLWSKGLLTSKLTANQFKTQRYVAINTFNRAMATSHFSLNGTTVEVDLKKISSGAYYVDKDTGDNGWTQQYTYELMKSKQSPNTVAGDVSKDDKLLKALQKGRDTITTKSDNADLQAAAKELAIRRSCKFGIEYAISLNTGAMIHYVLDGMDMLKVAQKDWFAKNIQTTDVSISFRKVSICTSELRYLFRYWGRISKTGRVQSITTTSISCRHGQTISSKQPKSGRITRKSSP